jgi:enoyl-CoA hydratase/carnithine racemase/carbon monoxide dehydrogenase subunit G
MEMKDEIRLEAPREAVWNALNDPAVLKACIPGCETLDKVSDTEFTSLVVAKVGPIKAKFNGKVTLADIVPLTSYRLIGEGQGGVAGFAKSDITVELIEEAEQATLLRYGVSANIGGKIAQLGTRLIDSTARKMADQFFASFNEAVRKMSVQATQEAGAAIDGAMSVAAAVPASDDILVTLVDVREQADIDEAIAKTSGNGGVAAKLAELFGFGKGKAQDRHSAPASGATQSSPVFKAAVVTLNRPRQKNAVTLAMWQDLGRIFQELGDDPQVRAILLTGAGGTFSAGADIAEFDKVRATVKQGEDYEVAVDACCDAIAASPKPTIAVIDGFCMGGACNLAMSCDFRFAHPEAKFAIPAARLSIVYGVRGTQRLLTLVGVANAKRILYSAQRFDASEGQQIGFVDRVSGDPMRSAQSFAAVMANNAPLTISGTKFLLNGLTMGQGVLTDQAIDKVIKRAVASEDYRNARQAFVEKRVPEFVGK